MYLKIIKRTRVHNWEHILNLLINLKAILKFLPKNDKKNHKASSQP